MAYDHFGQKVLAKYANNTLNRYSYEPDLRRLKASISKTSLDPESGLTMCFHTILLVTLLG